MANIRIIGTLDYETPDRYGTFMASQELDFKVQCKNEREWRTIARTAIQARITTVRKKTPASLVLGKIVFRGIVFLGPGDKMTAEG